MSVLTVAGAGIPDYSRSTRLDYPAVIRHPSLPAAPRPTPSSSTSTATYSYTRPERKAKPITPPQPQPRPQPQRLAQPALPAHHHTRTSSSAALPSPLLRSLGPQSQQPPSTGHSSQSSVASNTMNIQRQPTGASLASSLPRRSTSGRSVATNSPSSYVALMRKQKATVWCDRAQATDVRTEAARRAAKHRAHLAVQSSGNPSSGRTSTLSSGGVVGKIRHGGVPKAPGYVPANMSGAGVPMRLSANEMLGDEDDEGYVKGDNPMASHAGRSGSGKSSTNSAKYRSGYPRVDAGRFSTTSTPPSGEGGSPAAKDRIPEESHPAPDTSKTDYYATREKEDSGDEDSFGEFKELSGPKAADTAAAQTKKAEDLRRRGSVDERAMSMGSGVKLFVANPDLDD